MQLLINSIENMISLKCIYIYICYFLFKKKIHQTWSWITHIISNMPNISTLDQGGNCGEKIKRIRKGRIKNWHPTGKEQNPTWACNVPTPQSRSNGTTCNIEWPLCAGCTMHCEQEVKSPPLLPCSLLQCNVQTTPAIAPSARGPHTPLPLWAVAFNHLLSTL